jgi:hypothetical protein
LGGHNLQAAYTGNPAEQDMARGYSAQVFGCEVVFARKLDCGAVRWEAAKCSVMRRSRKLIPRNLREISFGFAGASDYVLIMGKLGPPWAGFLIAACPQRGV